MVSFDLDLIEEKDIMGCKVRICNDDWYDYIEIFKNGELIKRIYPANLKSLDLNKIVKGKLECIAKTG